jgi:hypothetical protein
MKMGVPTLVPCWNELETIDHLRIEARGDLDSHASRIEQKVQQTKVSLPPPFHLIFLNNSCQDWISLMAEVDETHPGGSKVYREYG